MDRGHKPSLEFPTGSGFIDVFDHTTRTAYEVELNKSPTKAKEKLELYRKNASVEDVIILHYPSLIDECSDISGFIDLDKLFKRVAEYVL